MRYFYIQLYFTTYLCEFVQRLSLIAHHTSKVGILSRGTRLASDLLGFLIIRRRSISYNYMLMARSKKKKTERFTIKGSFRNLSLRESI